MWHNIYITIFTKIVIGILSFIGKATHSDTDSKVIS
jgi:hypothetical protein